MDKEKLIIKNFGPIKSVELDLGRFNILIGEQATGKSTVAKVLAVCRYFSYIVGRKGILREVDGIYYSTVNMDVPFIDGLEAWGINDSIKSDTYISYTCSKYQITFDRANIDDFPVVEIRSLSDDFTNLLSELKQFNEDQYDFNKNNQIDLNSRNIAIPVANIPFNFYKNNVSVVMDNPFYIPTERGLQSIFSLGKNSIQNISDSLFSQFAKIDEIARNFQSETEIEPLSISYENKNGHGFVKKNGEDSFHKLGNAASGYQSTIPIILLLKYYELKERKKTFIIEEPELNLFPATQDKLMRYLVANTIENGNRMFLTTHSPYTLTSINNMMFAHQVGGIDREKTKAILEEKYWLNPDEVSAYRLTTDGGYENLMDEEIKQIKAERIDEISREFNKDYDAMLDIKYAG